MRASENRAKWAPTSNSICSAEMEIGEGCQSKGQEPTEQAQAEMEICSEMTLTLGRPWQEEMQEPSLLSQITPQHPKNCSLPYYLSRQGQTPTPRPPYLGPVTTV